MKERNVAPEAEPSTAPHVPLDVASGMPEKELSSDPTDFSAVGGPDGEPAYGRTRALAGEYPFNEQGGPYDRDEPAGLERGGIQTHHEAPQPTRR